MKHATLSDIALAEQRVENRRALARVQMAQVAAHTQQTVAGVQRTVTHPLFLGAVAAIGIFAGRSAGKSRRRPRDSRRSERRFEREKAGGLIATLLASATPMLMRHGMALAQDILLRRQGARPPSEDERAAAADGHTKPRRPNGAAAHP